MWDKFQWIQGEKGTKFNLLNDTNTIVNVASSARLFNNLLVIERVAASLQEFYKHLVAESAWAKCMQLIKVILH